MFPKDYANFDLEITRLGRGKYQARVIDSPFGQASAEFKRPFSKLKLENFVLKIGHTRTGTRSLNSPEMQAVEAFGKKLFNTVFKESVLECLASSLHQIDLNEISGLRLRLRLVSVPELADLPWEYLYHPTLRRFIVLSKHTPIVRYTDLPRPERPLTVTAPLRLLVMVAGPSDYPPLDVDQERKKIEEALHELEQRGLIAIEWLEKATLSALQERLQKGPVHLFHFIGHGGWDPEAQDGVLLFENEQQRGQRVKAGYLATILHDHESLRLVVLNACEGGRISPTDPFAGVAATLVQQGIPAVLAMQFEITDLAAIKLARVFYMSLANGYSAEAALAEARKAIFASGNDVEWGTPVLYLRAQDGRLFDLKLPSTHEEEIVTPPLLSGELQLNEVISSDSTQFITQAERNRIKQEQTEQNRLAQEKAEAERVKQERLEKKKARAAHLAARKAKIAPPEGVNTEELQGRQLEGRAVTPKAEKEPPALGKVEKKGVQQRSDRSASADTFERDFDDVLYWKGPNMFWKAGRRFQKELDLVLEQWTIEANKSLKEYNDDIGKLIIHKDSLEFQGMKFNKLLIEQIKTVSKVDFNNMRGYFYVNDTWLKVEYGAGSPTSVAYFAIFKDRYRLDVLQKSMQHLVKK